MTKNKTFLDPLTSLRITLLFLAFCCAAYISDVSGQSNCEIFNPSVQERLTKITSDNETKLSQQQRVIINEFISTLCDNIKHPTVPIKNNFIEFGPDDDQTKNLNDQEKIKSLEAINFNEVWSEQDQLWFVNAIYRIARSNDSDAKKALERLLAVPSFYMKSSKMLPERNAILRTLSLLDTKSLSKTNNGNFMYKQLLSGDFTFEKEIWDELLGEIVPARDNIWKLQGLVSMRSILPYTMSNKPHYSVADFTQMTLNNEIKENLMNMEESETILLDPRTINEEINPYDYPMTADIYYYFTTQSHRVTLAKINIPDNLLPKIIFNGWNVFQDSDAWLVPSIEDMAKAIDSLPAPLVSYLTRINIGDPAFTEPYKLHIRRAYTFNSNQPQAIHFTALPTESSNDTEAVKDTETIHKHKPEALAKTLVHETGHLLFNTLEEEIQEKWRNLSDVALPSEYAKKDMDEAFAEAVALYVALDAKAWKKWYPIMQNQLNFISHHFPPLAQWRVDTYEAP